MKKIIEYLDSTFITVDLGEWFHIELSKSFSIGLTALIILIKWYW